MRSLRAAAARWRRSDSRLGALQLLATGSGLAALAAAAWVFSASTAAVVFCSGAAGLFGVRLFVLFHDLAHHSLLPGRRANEVLGAALGVLLMTPYHRWCHDHATHHAGVGNLDRRGPGDVAMLTVREFERASSIRRALHRVFRFPPATYGLVAPYLFDVHMRLPPPRGASSGARASVHFTSLGLLGWLAALWLALGPRLFIAAVLPWYAVMSAGVLCPPTCRVASCPARRPTWRPEAWGIWARGRPWATRCWACATRSTTRSGGRWRRSRAEAHSGSQTTRFGAPCHGCSASLRRLSTACTHSPGLFGHAQMEARCSTTRPLSCSSRSVCTQATSSSSAAGSSTGLLCSVLPCRASQSMPEQDVSSTPCRRFKVSSWSDSGLL
jgi:fatty acid desaturase